MQTFNGKSMLDIYKQAIPFLLETPEEIRSPRGQKVHEIIGAHIRIDNPMCCLWTGGIDSREYPIQYLKNELIAYLSCTSSLKDFERISKFWGQLSDDDKTVNSAYGNIIYELKLTNKQLESKDGYFDSSLQYATLWQNEVFTQFNWVVESFKKDRDTRQAIMFVASPFFQYNYNKDFICTLNYHFIINSRGELDMIVNRRSQDIHFGMTFDIPWEVVLQMTILHEIQKFYPDVKLGAYMLNCNSLHMYDRNFDIYRNFATDKTLKECYIPEVKGNYFRLFEIIQRAAGLNWEYVGDDCFLNWLFNSGEWSNES